MQPMEDPAMVTVDRGRYTGKTLADVLAVEPDYIRYLARKATNAEVRSGAALLVSRGLPAGDNTSTFENEHFPTPPWIIQEAMTLVQPLFLDRMRRTKQFTILDIGSGDGRWAEVARERFPGAYIVGVELRDVPKPEWVDAWLVGDFFGQMPALHPLRGQVDLVIGNPPFSLALRMILRALEEFLTPDGCVAMMLRSAFASGVKRYRELYHPHPLYMEGVLVNRPSFMPELLADGTPNPKAGRSDKAQEYSIFIWKMGWHGAATKIWLMHDELRNELASQPRLREHA